MNHSFSTDHLSVEARSFFLAYGRCVIAWNGAEQQVRQLLSALISGETHSVLGNILSAELGTRAIAETLQSIANDILVGDAATEVCYVAKLFSIISGHRNYIIHGPAMYSDVAGGAVIHSWSAKGKLKKNSDVYTIEQIHEFTGWCWDLMNFANGVMFAMYSNAPPNLEPSSWPEKPHLPPAINKSARDWRELRRPRPASPE